MRSSTTNSAWTVASYCFARSSPVSTPRPAPMLPSVGINILLYTTGERMSTRLYYAPDRRFVRTGSASPEQALTETAGPRSLGEQDRTIHLVDDAEVERVVDE